MSKSGAKTEMDRLRLGSVLGKIRLDIWNDKKMILNIHSNIMEKYPFNMQLYHDMKTNLDSFLMTSGGGSDVSRVQNRLNEMEEDDILKIHLGIADLETKCMERFALMEEAWNVTVFSEEVDTMTDLKIKEVLQNLVTDQRMLRYNEHQSSHDLIGILSKLANRMLTCLGNISFLSDNFYKLHMRGKVVGSH